MELTDREENTIWRCRSEVLLRDLIELFRSMKGGYSEATNQEMITRITRSLKTRGEY